MYEELISRLKNLAMLTTENGKSEIWVSAEAVQAIREIASEAADAIEELANKLCDWCGVCPKEKRRPWECEIMWPDAPTIIPAEEGE